MMNTVPNGTIILIIIPGVNSNTVEDPLPAYLLKQSNQPCLMCILIIHGGLSQWGRSNRPRIRPGTLKSLNAPLELS